MVLSHLSRSPAGTRRYGQSPSLPFLVINTLLQVKNYTDYPVPIFLSEFGCNVPSPRVFDEIKSLYSSDMTGVFSGGLVYEFTQETNNFGLVKISPNGTYDEKLVDFNNLQKMYKSTANPTGDGGYQQNLPAKSCPAQDDLWQASNTLPALPSGASQYMVCLTSFLSPSPPFDVLLT